MSAIASLFKKLFARKRRDGTLPPEETYRYLEVERRLIRWLVETRSVLIHSDVLATIVRQVMGADPRAVADRLGFARVYGDGERELYIYAPLLDDGDVELVRGVVGASYLRARLSCLNEVVAAVLYSRLAAPWERGDPMAWYHGTLISDFYEIVDEVVKVPGYLPITYYRVGDVWIREIRRPCSEFMWPYDQSTCVEYEYVAPVVSLKSGSF